MSKTLKKMTAKEMREMVGCAVSYRGRQATIASVRPDMERLGKPSMTLQFADGSVAILRPSELASSLPAVDPRIEVGKVAGILRVDGKTLLQRAGNGLVLRASLDGDRFVLIGGEWGEHSIATDFRITTADRLLAHWNGYLENNSGMRRAS